MLEAARRCDPNEARRRAHIAAPSMVRVMTTRVDVVCVLGGYGACQLTCFRELNGTASIHDLVQFQIFG